MVEILLKIVVSQRLVVIVVLMTIVVIRWPLQLFKVLFVNIEEKKYFTYMVNINILSI